MSMQIVFLIVSDDIVAVLDFGLGGFVLALISILVKTVFQNKFIATGVDVVNCEVEGLLVVPGGSTLCPKLHQHVRRQTQT